jgi:hypothetical protein
MAVHRIPGKAINIEIMADEFDVADFEIWANDPEVGGLFTAKRMDDSEDTSYTRDVLKLIDKNSEHFIVTLPLRGSLSGPIVLKRTNYNLLELPRLSEEDIQ